MEEGSNNYVEKYAAMKIYAAMKMNPNRGVNRDEGGYAMQKAINKILTQKIISLDIGNINNVEYNKNGNTIEKLIPLRDTFTDNIIVRCFYIEDTDVAVYYTLVKTCFTNIGFSNFSIKMNACIKNKYISFKITLSEENVENVIKILKEKQEYLKHKNIHLHDLDISIDCAGSITRENVYKHITEKLGILSENIIDDIHKTGKNCISWMMITEDDIKIRIKVYNKFVQMLESPGVQTSIGSLLSELIANSSITFQQTLTSAKESGLTRIEVTIYSEEIYGYNRYKSFITNALKMLEGCKVYKTTFQDQWKALVDEIQSTVAIYVDNKQTFAYCHWYNSLTGKKQGYIKAKIGLNEVKTLLANYSFNNRIMHYTCANIDDNGISTIKEEAKYIRVEGCVSYTLVPGAKQGLYPSISSLNRPTIPFSEIGIIPYKGVHINWPETRFNKNSKPLASLIRIEDSDSEDEEDVNLEILTDIPVYKYRAGYAILNPGEKYHVVAIGKALYRKKEAVFAKLTKLNEYGKRETINVRCGESFCQVIEERQNNNTFAIQTGAIYNKYNHVKDIHILLSL